MKYCNRCSVSVDSPVLRCPLCYTVLSQKDNSPELQSYPFLAEQAKKYNLMLRLLLFLSVTSCVVCVTINLIVTPAVLWSLLVVGNISYVWIAIGTAVKRKGRLGFNVLVQVLSLSALLVFIDAFTGYKNWALNYVVPFLIISAVLSITIIMIAQRMKMSSFLVYFFLTALLGFIPIILVAFRLITVLWPALVCALYCGLSLISMFIFADKATKSELKKRLHI